MPLPDPIVNVFQYFMLLGYQFLDNVQSIFIVIGNNAHIVGTEQKPRDSTIT